MTWNETIGRLYAEHGATDDFDRALIAALVNLLDSGIDPRSREVHEAVVRTWIGIMSPIQAKPRPFWRQLFASTGPIEFHRPIPSEPTVAYRVALPDWARGWSWSADPRSGMYSETMGLEQNFDLQRWWTPKQRWYRTTLHPSAILAAVPDGLPVLWRGTIRPSIDEFVVDQDQLGVIEKVPTSEMREMFFAEKAKPLNPLLISE
ncbi:hypothetical protein [Lacisediminihabitans sp. H27-G8]|uniref:hypothetical protein n=1 Tax=Lacisediminihabitans sp. H27-G8 TaxID=3111909 RepID=UPI0038FC70AA